MRLAFEEVTGQDLNWFWNQWYFGSGHPKLNIDYKYDDAAGKAQVIISQTQDGDKIFKLPFAIDVYNGTAKVRTKVWMNDKVDTFTFNYTQHPDLINVDADKILLCEKTDNKTFSNYVHQYKNAPLYLDRKEALDYFNKEGLQALTLGLTDNYAPLRRSTITQLADSKLASDPDVIKSIETIANTETDKKTLAAALNFLVKNGDAKYLPLYNKYVNDSSYSVAGAALNGINNLQPDQSYALAKKYSMDAKGALGDAVAKVLIAKGSEDDYDFIANRYGDSPPNQAKFDMTASYCKYLETVKDISNVKKGIDDIIKFRNQIPEQYRSFTDPVMKGALDKLATAKGAEIADYIKSNWK